MRTRSPLATFLLGLLLVVPVLVAGRPAPAAAASGVVVSLGDSYISGEAGRWYGNSLTNSGSRNGTDRAFLNGTYDKNRVYLEGTASDGCHRSDVADVRWAGAPLMINLACSGAVTANIHRASNGGVSQNGRPPQADQLATVASQHQVAAVVLSVGGNDLGFRDIILQCAEDWFSSPSWWKKLCHPQQQANVDQRMPAAMNGVRKAIDEVRAVMAAAGQTNYRFILRSYPSPIPRGNQNRYSESGWSRWDYGGCPFWNADSDWARLSLVPQISDNLATVAAQKGVEFQDLRDAMSGREVCAKTASQVGSSGPNGATAEWVRWMNTGWVQGDAQESLHPNAYGQQAQGTCLRKQLQAPVGNYRCAPTAGQGPTAMVLTSR